MVGLAVRDYSRKGGSSAELRPKMQCFRREEGSLWALFKMREGRREEERRHTEREDRETRVWRWLEWTLNTRLRNLSEAYRMLDVWKKQKPVLTVSAAVPASWFCALQVLPPSPYAFPKVHALWWFTAGNSSSCSCSLKRGKLISSGRSSFWLEILWMIDNLQAPGFSSIARSSKEHADCTCNITEECNKNLSEEGRKSNRRTVLGQSYVSVPDNISSSCSQITKLGQQKLDVADQTLNNSDISPANSISHFQWHLFQVRFCCSVMPSVEHHRQSAI